MDNNIVSINSDIIIAIIPYIKKLSTINNLLNTCIEYYSIYNNIPYYLTKKKVFFQSDIEDILYGIDRLLCRNSQLCFNLNREDFITVLLRYSTMNNISMFEHINKSASPENTRIANLAKRYFEIDIVEILKSPKLHKYNIRKYRDEFMEKYQEYFSANAHVAILRILIEKFRAIPDGIHELYDDILLNIREYFFDENILSTFIRYGNVDIDYEHDYHNILYYTIDNRLHCDEFLKIILNYGAKVDCNVISHACQKSTAKVVEILLDSGANVNINLLLFNVIYHNYPNHTRDIIKLLINRGANINIQDSRGVTPLLSAVVNHATTEIVMALLENGADPYIEDCSGETALEWIMKLHAMEEWKNLLSFIKRKQL